ncbi:MAG: hypothetical protein U1F43_12140 [Myxococcota bacterium]
MGPAGVKSGARGRPRARPQPSSEARRPSRWRRAGRWLGRLALVASVGVVALFTWVVAVPFPREALTPMDLGSSVIVDRDGHVLREVLADDGSRGRWVPLAQISPNLQMATIEAEDHRFRDHAGPTARPS